MAVEPSWRMSWPTDLKPLPRPIQQQIDDGFWIPDTRLEAIADEWAEYKKWKPSDGLPALAAGFDKVADLLDALTNGEA